MLFELIFILLFMSYIYLIFVTNWKRVQKFIFILLSMICKYLIFVTNWKRVQLLFKIFLMLLYNNIQGLI